MKKDRNREEVFEKMAKSKRQTRTKHKERVKSSSKGKCPYSGKVRYRDAKEATRALHRSHNARAIELNTIGESRRRECRAYWCEKCEGMHTTSQTEWIH